MQCFAIRFEINDGSCRWRQSSSEVKVIALKVPRDAKPSQLAISISPYHIKVASKESGEVYLEGQLERGIVPDASLWVAGQGEGEDGFIFYLHKMNLELLQTCGSRFSGFVSSCGRRQFACATGPMLCELDVVAGPQLPLVQ